MRHRPSAIVHCDWSRNQAKRWMATAVRRQPGYEVASVRPVGDVALFLDRVRGMAREDAPVLLGFDFPIGLPRTFARRVGIRRFLDALPAFGTGRWRQFFCVADRTTEVSLFRPFYPERAGAKGEKCQGPWLDRLGFAADDLLRACERGSGRRRDAALLFWTVGGQQSGKAAIHGWSEVIAPLLRDRSLAVSVWPFGGPLDSLLRDSSVVVCETYPAEVHGWLGVAFGHGRGHGKASQAARRARAATLVDWLTRHRIAVAEDLVGEIHDGFGPSRTGEDGFDALLGLLGMLDVVANGRGPGEPRDAAVRAVEGWILGQATGPDDPAASPPPGRIAVRSSRRMQRWP